MAECAPSRPLPIGKDYHVFFSYRNVPEDQEWTRNVIRELELTGIKCCDHEIEFTPGKEILENIKDFMGCSIKTVLVFSKAYIESYYCKLEVQYSLHKALTERKHILIPVKREDCDLPVDMEFFTWIDAKGSAQVWLPKLIDAIDAPVDTELTQPALRMHRYENFNTIFRAVSKASCCGAAFENSSNPNYLSRSSIDFDPENFTRIIQEISSSKVIRQRMYINPWWLICVIKYFIIPECLIGGIVVDILYSLGYYDSWVWILLGIGSNFVFLVFGIIWPSYCIVANKKGRREMKDKLYRMNRDLLASNICMTYSINRMKAEVTIYFLYYDLKPCLEFMKSQRKQRNSETGLKEISETNEEDVVVPLLGSDSCQNDHKGEDLELLLQVSFSYFQKYLAGKLSKTGQMRHTESVICLCQYAENNIEKHGQQNIVIEV